VRDPKTRLIQVPKILEFGQLYIPLQGKKLTEQAFSPAAARMDASQNQSLYTAIDPEPCLVTASEWCD
jgi:hypothetical protein